MRVFIMQTERRKGRWVRRARPLHIPLALATGELEELSDLQLREVRRDLNHEYLRRQGGLFK